MCGIAGILFHDANRADPSRVARMCDAMAHRGPDAAGHFDEGRISLGHRRLSIIDLSTSANQPLFDDSGRYVIVFNGEMYNFLDVRRELEGYPFRTHGDTEVILAAFAKWGPACVHRFKGFFAMAIWDRTSEELYLFRDRLGVKPLYVHQDNGQVVFASEIRAVLASGLVAPVFDHAMLNDYLSFQSFGYPGTPVKGVEQLEAGSWMKVSRDRIEKTVYWRAGDAAPMPGMDDKAFVQGRIRELLKRSVEQRLVSDVPVGAFLSGGIDSSTVVGLMAECSTARPATFNISFDEEDFDESAYARIIARKFNTDHTEIRLSPKDFLAELEHALDAMDTPSADGPNTYVVSKAIRNAGITVALSGVGGDELFAGYPFFRSYMSMHRMKPLFDSSRAIRRVLARAYGLTPATVKRERIQQLLKADRLDISHAYPEFRRILSPGLVRQLTRIHGSGRTELEGELLAHQERLGRLPLLSQVSAAEYLGYTQQTLLKDTDQMSMAVALEVREPFFDHELVDFVLQVPDHLKDPVYPKSLLVESVKPLLPDEIVHRKKKGFLFPWSIWMRGELREFCAARIGRIAQREFINGEALQDYWKRFLNNDPNVRWTELWQFVVLEHWLEKNGFDR